MHVLWRKDYNTHKVPTSFVIFPLVVICCLLVFWYCGESGNLDDDSILLLSIAGMLLFGVTIIMFVTFQHQREREYEYIQMKNDNARLNIERSYYEMLEDQNRQLMLYAHDAKNHLAAMQSLNNDPRMAFWSKVKGTTTPGTMPIFPMQRQTGGAAR